VVPADSDRVSRARPYSGTQQGRLHAFAYGTIALCGATFQSLRLTRSFVTSRPAGRRIKSSPPTPDRQRLPPVTSIEFGLFPFRSPLLRESRFLSFPRATKMFQFARLALPCLCIQQRVRAHYHAWVSPFGDPRVKGWSAPHRGLSQPPTSFIASWRQGIRRVPFVLLIRREPVFHRYGVFKVRAGRRPPFRDSPLRGQSRAAEAVSQNSTVSSTPRSTLFLGELEHRTAEAIERVECPPE
jgi:hypothetical protein